MEQRRYLRCLGQPVLFAPTGEPVRFRTKKHLALLIYIAVEPRSHRRDRLAELLWPEVTPTDARHSLATALSTLRPRLGPDGLESGRDHVHLAPGRVTLDLERLEAGDVLGTEITGPLDVAAFLDGFDIPDSSEFTHWKDRQQARLLPMIKDSLVVLIDRCRRTGDFRQIERLADKMLALDFLSEEAVRAKMEARAFAGDRLTALEIFEDWRMRLAEELQAAPSELVEGMAIRLRRRGWERTTLPKVPNVPTDQWRGRPFIGRTAEYRALYEAWEDVRRGVPRHALILGDSGVGKSTLVERLTTAAGLEGAAVSRVQCYDLEREIPYSTLSGLVLGLLDRPGVSATAPESLAELSRTIPEVRRRFPNIPPSQESQGETARIRLTEAVLDMLTAIAEEHPIVLVIDDLHLADDVSLAVLHLIMRRTGRQPVMIVFVARPGELHLSPQAARLRETSEALGIHDIELSPLTPTESQELLASLIPTDEQRPSFAAQRALVRAAAGYPMVMELLVQDWRAYGEQSLALCIEAMTEDSELGALTRVPYRKIVDRLTHSLDAATRSVLNLASLLGQRLNDLSMYALVDLSVVQTMTGIAELVNRRVLRDGVQGLEFVNEMVRASVYLCVPPSMRKVLHSKIATCFIERTDHQDATLGLEIAWHCLRAGRAQEATEFLLRGAREALNKGAVHAAERALYTAIPHLGGPEMAEVTLLLAEVLQEQGRWQESLDVLADAPLQDHPEAALVLTIVARHRTTVPSIDVILADLKRLREVINTSTDLRVRLRASNAGAAVSSSLRDVRLSRELLLCINAIPTSTLDDDDLAYLAEAKARVLYSAQELGPCLKEIRSVADNLCNVGHVNSTIASLHAGLGTLACCEGRYADAKPEFLRSYQIHNNLGNDSFGGARAAQVALCCYRLGEYEDVVEWSGRAMATFGIQFEGYAECITAVLRASSYALRGDYKKPLEEIERIDSRIRQTVPPWVLQAWHLYKADILYLVGQHSEALAVGRKAIGDETPTLHSPFFAGAFCRWTALTSKGTRLEAQGRESVSRMENELTRFDAIDQVEILCSSNVIGSQPENASIRRTLLRHRLAVLPAAIPEQLLLLGLRPYD